MAKWILKLLKVCWLRTQTSLMNGRSRSTCQLKTVKLLIKVWRILTTWQFQIYFYESTNFPGADLKPRAGTIQFLAHCLPFQMGYNCPESVLKDAAKCRKEKNYREQCEYQSLHVQVFCWKSEILGCFHYAIHNVWWAELCLVLNFECP